MSATLYEFAGKVRLLVPSTTGDAIDAKLTADTVFESIRKAIERAVHGSADGTLAVEFAPPKRSGRQLSLNGECIKTLSRIGKLDFGSTPLGSGIPDNAKPGRSAARRTAKGPAKKKPGAKRGKSGRRNWEEKAAAKRKAQAKAAR